MSEKIRKINGVEICTESFGNPNHPPVLLIMGGMCSMIYWDDEFCQGLAESGRYVIRFDNRDVGRSITYPPGESHYTVVDMADDAVGVLDSYGVDQAHIVGLSLGGMIAQIIAVRHPQRVLTITLIATTIFGSDDIDRGLPPMGEQILAHHADAATLDWLDEEAVATYLVNGSRLMCGAKHYFDEHRAYKQVKREIKRANYLVSMLNHGLLKGDDAYEGKLKEIHVPVLVIHGTGDTILPLEHGVALANEVPNASLLTVEGMGHEVHLDDWDMLIKAISNHTLLA